MARPSRAPGRAITRVAENRKARHNYFIDEQIEAGIVLEGPEVKSLRQGQANIAESYAEVCEGGLQLVNAYIAPYEQANRFNVEPRRPRRLLLHKREIERLSAAVRRGGMTVVPLSLYFNERGRAKVLLGLARGKKMHDKRASEKERDWKREKGRLMRDKG
jgi:SsrA-binding protein